MRRSRRRGCFWSRTRDERTAARSRLRPLLNPSPPRPRPFLTPSPPRPRPFLTPSRPRPRPFLTPSPPRLRGGEGRGEEVRGKREVGSRTPPPHPNPLPPQTGELGQERGNGASDLLQQ